MASCQAPRSPASEVAAPVEHAPRDHVVVPTYTKIHQVLTNPVHVGADVHGGSPHERHVDAIGRAHNRTHRLPRAARSIALRGHPPGFINRETFDENEVRIAAITHPVLVVIIRRARERRCSALARNRDLRPMRTRSSRLLQRGYARPAITVRAPPASMAEASAAARRR